MVSCDKLLEKNLNSLQIEACVCFMLNRRFSYLSLTPNQPLGMFPHFTELVTLSTISHINSETNPPPPIINVVCKYLRQFLGTSIGVATLPIYCNTERGQIYFCKVNHSKIFRNFSRNWVGLNNLCDILQVDYKNWYSSQKNIVRSFPKGITTHCVYKT